MKHIVKNNEPASFTAWKLAHPNARYQDLNRPTKGDVKSSLLIEQKYVCCYCECRISDNNSHIEHFKPQGTPAFRHLDLVYSNLHASCIKNCPAGVDLHCGHKKGEYFSGTLVSPLEVDCHTHFSYRMDGHIHHLDERGEEAIREYNLDSELLVQKRKAIIDLLTMDEITEQDIEDYLDDTQPQLGEFFTMVEYLHKNNNI